jgi:hypothetical protein
MDTKTFMPTTLWSLSNSRTTSAYLLSEHTSRYARSALDMYARFAIWAKFFVDTLFFFSFSLCDGGATMVMSVLV